MREAGAGLVINLHACVLDVGGADVVEERIAVAAGVPLLGLFAHCDGWWGWACGC